MDLTDLILEMPLIVSDNFRDLIPDAGWHLLGHHHCQIAVLLPDLLCVLINNVEPIPHLSFISCPEQFINKMLDPRRKLKEGCVVGILMPDAALLRDFLFLFI